MEYLRDVFSNRSMVKIDGVTRMPFSEAIVEIELHEMACDGGEGHMARLSIDGVTELEYLIVSGPSISYPQSSLLVLR